MKEELKKVALDSLKSFVSLTLADLPAVIETIQKCYCTNSNEDNYLREELQFFIDGLKKSV